MRYPALAGLIHSPGMHPANYCHALWPSRATVAWGVLGLVLSALWSAPVRAAASASFEIKLLYGDKEIFPSALLTTTDRSPLFPPRIPQLGDPTGLIAVELISPADDCPVTVTLAATAISRESAISLRLPRKGESYRVAPYLVLDHARLVELKHPIPGEVLRATVALPDTTTTVTTHVRIHSMNDCLTLFRLDGKVVDVAFLTAAYVNEYNAEVADRVIRRAHLVHEREHGRRPALFLGYEPGGATVEQQVGAVYNALKDFGFKYSSATRASITDSDNTRCQWVRLSSDSLRSDQANCVDGSVILASVLTRLGLRVLIFVRPAEHTFLGVYRTATAQKLDDLIVVETTELGTHDFKSAQSTGRGLLDKHIGFIAGKLGRSPTHVADLVPVALAKLGVGLKQDAIVNQTSLFVVDVQAARRDHGILPVPELMPGSRWRFPEFPR